MKPANSPVFLTFSLVVFTAVFSAFLFFNDDPVAKVLTCSFTGIFMVLTAVRLIEVTRRGPKE